MRSPRARRRSHGKSPTLGGHADRKSTRLNSSHSQISYAVFCLKKKTIVIDITSHRNISPIHDTTGPQDRLQRHAAGLRLVPTALILLCQLHCLVHTVSPVST